MNSFRGFALAKSRLASLGFGVFLGLIGGFGTWLAGGSAVLACVVAFLLVAVGGILAALLIHCLRMNTKLRQLEAVGRRGEKYASQAVYFDKQLPNLSSSIQSMHAQMSEISAQVESGSGLWLRLEEGDVVEHVPGSMGVRRRGHYDPKAIPAYAPPPEASGSSLSGRAAASREDDPSSPAKLWFATHGDADPRTMRILVAGTSDLQQALADQYDVVSLYPGMLHSDLAEGASYLVIERAAFMSGVWSGAETTSGTALFRELSDFARLLHSNGAVVVLLDGDEIPSHYTQEFLKLADIVLDRGNSLSRWAPDVGTSVLRSLRHFQEVKELDA